MSKLIQIIRNFFSKLKKVNNLLIEEKVTYNEQEKIKKKDFKEKLNKSTNEEIIKLQNEYERGNISEKNLSKNKLKELIMLYEKEITDLNIEISIKKAKLNKV